jgi:hypothetical protein
VLEEELYGFVVSVIVEKGPHAASFYENIVLRSFPFLQQDRFCRNFQPLLQWQVFVPKGI